MMRPLALLFTPHIMSCKCDIVVPCPAPRYSIVSPDAGINPSGFSLAQRRPAAILDLAGSHLLHSSSPNFLLDSPYTAFPGSALRVQISLELILSESDIFLPGGFFLALPFAKKSLPWWLWMRRFNLIYSRFNFCNFGVSPSISTVCIDSCSDTCFCS